LVGWEWGDYSSRPIQANSTRDPIFTITREKWTASVAQVIELQFCKCEALSSNPSPIKKEKEKKRNG
jgi:hypothetical protein